MRLATSPPFDASRKIGELPAGSSSPSDCERRHRRARRSRTEGHFRWSIWNSTPSFLRALGAQIRRAEVGRARAEVGVAVEAAGLREERRARDRGRRSRSPASSPSSGRAPATSLASALLRGRALVGERRPSRSRPGSRPRSRPAAASSRRSRRRSRNGSASSRIMHDRRDPDRAQDHRVRPLEDPQQVEEEVEVPVGPRHEARRRPGRPCRRRAARASPALGARVSPVVVLPDDGEPDDHDHDDQAHHRVVEHRVREERLPALLDVAPCTSRTARGARRRSAHLRHAGLRAAPAATSPARAGARLFAPRSARRRRRPSTTAAR